MVSPGAFGEWCPQAICSVQCRQSLGNCSDTSRQDLTASFRPRMSKSMQVYLQNRSGGEGIHGGVSDAPGLRRGNFPMVRAPETWSLMLTLLSMFCHLQQLCELFLAESGREWAMCSQGGPHFLQGAKHFSPLLSIR